MKKQLLILMTLFTVVIGYSQSTGDQFINDSMLYEITSITPNTVEIRSSSAASSAGGNIAATVDNNNITYSVTSIAVNAFLNNALTSITIPDSVVIIDSGAFGHPLLTCVISEATQPPTITTSNSSLTDSFGIERSNINLSIPSGTASAYAAAQWTGFNSVAAGLTGTFVVDYITYQINASPNNEVTITNYNTAGGTVVDIPATVVSGCTDFSVVSIGQNAFISKNLTSVTIPDSLISIGQGAFNNNSINNLVLGNNVESIGNWSFRYNNLNTLSIPNSVISIALYAFGNNSITNLFIGNSVETIGDNAFVDNTISSIIIPDSVLTIGDSAFADSNNTASLVLGNSVTTIGDAAFAINSINSTVTSITIPNSVTIIGDYAFYIASLTDVFSESTTPPTITTGSQDTFGARGAIHLHIPANTMGAYVTNTGALWTGFNPVTQDALLSTSNFELANDIKVINATDELKVISSGTARLENYTIYTISGAKVKEGTESTIAIEELSNGIYILKLDFDTGKLVKKFAK